MVKIKKELIPRAKGFFSPTVATTADRADMVVWVLCPSSHSAHECYIPGICKGDSCKYGTNILPDQTINWEEFGPRGRTYFDMQVTMRIKLSSYSCSTSFLAIIQHYNAMIGHLTRFCIHPYTGTQPKAEISR